MPQSSLCPGYRRVQSFGPDEDYTRVEDGEIEEISYVTLDLGSVEPTLVPSSSTYRLIVSITTLVVPTVHTSFGVM